MDTSDLRLGNYVDWGGPKKVLSIASDTVLLEHPENTDGCKPVHIHNIKGVALTPEILERSGFVESNGCYLLLTGVGQPDTWLSFREDWITPGLACFFVSHWQGQQEDMIHKMMKSLHQVQNLYFALFSEELNIPNHPCKGIK